MAAELAEILTEALLLLAERVDVPAGIGSESRVVAARWIGVYRATPPARRATAAADPISPRAALMIPPERNFPLSVVIGHGVLAVTTLVLVILTALGVGRS